jgi:hypothetical protein
MEWNGMKPEVEHETPVAVVRAVVRLPVYRMEEIGMWW